MTVNPAVEDIEDGWQLVPCADEPAISAASADCGSIPKYTAAPSL